MSVVKRVVTSLNDYQDLVFRTAGDVGDHERRLLFGAVGLTGESGEVADEIKKQVFHGKPRSAPTIALEIGDVLWYAAYLARQCGYTLAEVAQMNIDKLAARYPDGFKRQDEDDGEVGPK